MRITRGNHLTYCLNVHGGETWDDQRRAVDCDAVAVRDAVGASGPFGLGLRISGQAAAELTRAPDRVAAFRDELDAAGLYVFTVNAFPAGRFHGGGVKDNVYRPDWADPARLEYTLQVADILARLLPPDVDGSVSTAPLTFKGWDGWEARIDHGLERLVRAAARLAALERRTGRRIVLGIEPEPGCYPETTGELIAVIERLAAAGGDRVRAHVGCCFDAAHQMVAFEAIGRDLERLAAAGVRIAKAQLSAAIEAPCTDAALAELARFRDATYLHQVAQRDAIGRLHRWNDLPAFLDSDPTGRGGVARIHYHVPLFIDRFGTLRGTGRLLREDGALRALAAATAHLEVETYTWDIWRRTVGDATPLAEGIARELRWVREGLA